MNDLASLLLILLAGFVGCSLHVVQEEKGYDSFENWRTSWGSSSSDATLWLNNLPQIGISSLYCDGFPSPAQSIGGFVNVTQYSEEYCGKKSIFAGLVENNTIAKTFVCSGLQSFISPYNISAYYWNGTEVTLQCAAMYTRTASLNGNQINVQSCEIEEPAQCKGSMIFEVIIFEANSQYDCVLKGATSQTTIYQLSIITGVCQSQCWLTTGYRNLSSPVNNWGTPTSLGNTIGSTPSKLIRKLDRVIQM